LHSRKQHKPQNTGILEYPYRTETRDTNTGIIPFFGIPPNTNFTIPLNATTCHVLLLHLADKLLTQKIEILGVEAFGVPSVEEKNLCQLAVEWLHGTMINNGLTISDFTEHVRILFFLVTGDFCDTIFIMFAVQCLVAQ
jgi:hypothetical protein